MNKKDFRKWETLSKACLELLFVAFDDTKVRADEYEK